MNLHKHSEIFRTFMASLVYRPKTHSPQRHKGAIVMPRLFYLPEIFLVNVSPTYYAVLAEMFDR